MSTKTRNIENDIKNWMIVLMDRDIENHKLYGTHDDDEYVSDPITGLTMKFLQEWASVPGVTRAQNPNACDEFYNTYIPLYYAAQAKDYVLAQHMTGLEVFDIMDTLAKQKEVDKRGTK